jgi:hypothetical protein
MALAPCITAAPLWNTLVTVCKKAGFPGIKYGGRLFQTIHAFCGGTGSGFDRKPSLRYDLTIYNCNLR